MNLKIPKPVACPYCHADVHKGARHAQDCLVVRKETLQQNSLANLTSDEISFAETIHASLKQMTAVLLRGLSDERARVKKLTAALEWTYGGGDLSEAPQDIQETVAEIKRSINNRVVS